MILIGLTGRAGSGKDTVADYLVQRHGFTKLSFAAPLKAGLNAMFGFTPEQWNDREWKERVIPELGVSPRYLAQTLGTEWGRELVKQDLWPSLTMAIAKQYEKVVIADVRFENEAAAVSKNGGYVLSILRPDARSVNPHQSELPLNDSSVDAYVANVDSFRRLFEAVTANLNHLMGGTSWQAH